MQAQEILKQIKSLFTETPAPAPVAEPAVKSVIEAKEYELKDGTKVSIDKYEVGGLVKVGEDLAPAGTIELADGSSVVVGEGGVITAINAPAVEEVVKVEPPAGLSLAEFNDYKAANEAFFSEMKAKLEASEGKFNKLIELISQLSGEPAAQSVQKTFSEEKREARMGRFEHLRKGIK